MLVAVIGVSDVGQKKEDSGLGQTGMMLSGKNKPFDPLSIKLDVRLLPLLASFVVKLPFESTVNTVTLGKALFDWVPIPKVIDPLRVEAEPDNGGNWSATPLLSVAKNTTGWATC
jgi:hypothetical protein